MWSHGGYMGGGNVAPLLGIETGKTAVIVGSGRGGFDDLGRVLLVHPGAVVFAVNDAGMYLPGFSHWVTLHSEKMAAWASVRECDASLDQRFSTHSVTQGNRVEWVWAGLDPYFGLSGYFAMQIAYLMGFDQIILCGCPGDGTPRFFESSVGRPDAYAYNDKNIMYQFHNEMNRVPALKAKVKSMNGWTRHFFGSPKRFHEEHLFQGG